MVKPLIIVFDAGVLFLSGWAVYNHKKIEAAGLSCALFFSGRIKNGVRWFNALTRFERLALGIITLFSFGKALWYDIVFPLQYDEAWSYNYYIGNGLWQSFLLPSNNHKLFTFIAWWFNLLPFDKLFLIRTPNAFTGIFCLLHSLFYKNISVAEWRYWDWSGFHPCAGGRIYDLARSYIYVVFSLLY